MNPNLEDYVVLDIDSGTYFCAANACLINFAILTPEQRETLIEGTDTERALLADEVGAPFTPSFNDDEPWTETERAAYNGLSSVEYHFVTTMPDKQKIREFIDGLKDDDERLLTLEDFIVNHLGDEDENSEPEPLQAYSPVGIRIIGTRESVSGTALIHGFDPETKEHLYSGQTDIDWDSQVTETGKLSGPMYVDEIGDIWFHHQLSFRPL